MQKPGQRRFWLFVANEQYPATVGIPSSRICAGKSRVPRLQVRAACSRVPMRGLKKLSLSLSDIKSLLAHRAPFLYLASARHNVAGSQLTAALAPPASAAPPTRTVLLEALGQAGALVVRQHEAYAHEPLPAFAAMRGVLFRDWPDGVGREAAVDLDARLLHARRARFGVVKARALVEGEVAVCEAEFVFSFLEGGGKERQKGG